MVDAYYTVYRSGNYKMLPIKLPGLLMYRPGNNKMPPTRCPVSNKVIGYDCDTEKKLSANLSHN